MPTELGFAWRVVVCWILLFALWEVFRRAFPGAWPAAAARRPAARRWLDLGLAVLVPVSILALGQLWFAGTLRWQWPGAWRHLGYVLAQLLIWSPLALALVLRRQPLSSIWLPGDHVVLRGGVGAVLGLGAVALYLWLCGSSTRWPAILARTVTLQAWAHFVPVFLEACGVAFVYVRLRWAFGAVVAASVPGLLFAAAHLPRAIETGEPVGSVAVMFLVNAALVAGLVAWAARFRDVATLGVAHWLWDLAIDAF